MTENRDLGFELLGQFAHDLRTPLSALGMLLAAIEKDRKTIVPGHERFQRRLELMGMQLASLNRRVDEVAKVSSLSVQSTQDVAAALLAKAERYSMHKVCCAIAENYAATRESAGLEYVGDGFQSTLDRIGLRVVCEQDFELLAPLSWLERAIENVVKNAHNAIISAGTAGPHSIKIEISSLPCGTGSAATGLLKIIDTGSGMSQDVKARIFESGYTGSKVPGTGIGMGIVKDFFENVLKAQIDVLSAPGVGTQFHFRIPL